MKTYVIKQAISTGYDMKADIASQRRCAKEALNHLLTERDENRGWRWKIEVGLTCGWSFH